MKLLKKIIDVQKSKYNIFIINLIYLTIIWDYLIKVILRFIIFFVI